MQNRVLGQLTPEIKYGGFSVEFPIFETSKKHTTFRDTVHIYYQENMILYALPYIHESYKNNIYIDHKKSYEYLFVEKDNQKGLYFPSLNDTTKCRWILKDSLLVSRNIKDYKLNELLVYDSLIMRTISSDSVVKEKYISLNAYKGKLIDTLECYFALREKDFPYSLSSSFDSMHSRKLTKIRMVYNSRYYATIKSNIPKQVWTYELFQLELPDKNKQDMIDFFRLAKKLYREKEIN